MAIVRAVKSGNWSDTTVWNTGALPTSADDVYSNTFTVTIDVSPTVLSVQNGATTGVTAGGSFVPTNGITLTCTGAGVVGGSASVAVIASSLAVSQSCSIIGNCTGGSGGIAHAVNHSGFGTVNITGNLVATTNGGSGVLNGNVGVVNITGNATAAGNAAGVYQTGSGIINLTGTVLGGSGTASPGAHDLNGGTINHIGTVQATTSPGVRGSATTSTISVTGPFLTNSTSVAPVYAFKWTWASTLTPTYYQIRTANLATIRPLYTADSVGGNPATSNVRSGTVYGPAGELTGTCAVPPAQSVSYGVPVDNTTGTAYLSQADIVSVATTALSAASAITLNQSVSSIATPGSIGERLKNTATIASVSQQFSDVFSTRQ